MRRRRPLVILVALSLGAAVVFTLDPPGQHDAGRTAAGDRRDGLGRVDSVAPTARPEAEEPPCVASRLGLPCR